MDDTAVQLLHKIWSWLEQKEKCAENLWQLVKDLEVLRERCNAGECVGSSVSVIGAACLIGGAAATFFTAGAAAPFLGMLGVAYVGAGTTISLSSKLIEHFVSGSTMKDAKKVAKASEIIEEEITELMEKLKMERVNTDQTESEYIAVRLAEAMCGTVHTGQPLKGFATNAVILVVFIETFLSLSIKTTGKITKSLITMIIQEVALAGGKSAAKSMALAGGIGMVFALSESIDNWKELVEKKHVTEASKSLRITAENIDQFCKDLRNNLKMIQKAIEQTNQQTNTDQGNQSNQNQQTNNDQGNQSNQNQQTNSNQGNQSDKNQQNNNDQGNQSNQNQQTNSNQGDDDDEDKQQNNWVFQLTDSNEESDSDKESDSDEVPGDPMEGYVQMGLLNVRSMTKKAHDISDIIELYDLDVFLTTETWLRPSNFETVLQNASPPNFTFHHQARLEGRGGGVGVQHRNTYIGQQIRFSFETAFEYVAVVLENNQWEVPVLLINVYFPPGYTRRQFHRFVFDFNMLLDALDTMRYDHVIFTGDFNIHLDNGMQSSAIEFHMLLHARGLELHVNQATHIRGHTLDLVFTRNVDISNVSYFDFEFSDHFMIFFIAIPVSPDKKRKLVRKVKSLRKFFKF